MLALLGSIALHATAMAGLLGLGRGEAEPVSVAFSVEIVGPEALNADASGTPALPGSPDAQTDRMRDETRMPPLADAPTVAGPSMPAGPPPAPNERVRDEAPPEARSRTTAPQRPDPTIATVPSSSKPTPDAEDEPDHMRHVTVVPPRPSKPAPVPDRKPMPAIAGPTPDLPTERMVRKTGDDSDETDAPRLSPPAATRTEHQTARSDGSTRKGSMSDQPAVGEGKISQAVAAADNPAPRYPVSARRRGQEGRVLLDLRIAADGKVAAVSIRKSSGVRSLDRAAVDTVRTWRFDPARENGAAVSSEVTIPILFKLQDDLNG